MNFKDVIIKNFLWNIKQYLSLFLCSAFSITVFFIYATLIFNDGIVAGEQADFFSYVIPVTIVGISLFSIFFILYANRAFIKGRSKEFGIYMTLGMDSRELRNLVNWETIFISFCSLVIGLLTGTLFSRIFQMGIVSILELKGIKYHLDYRSFFLTIGAFVVVFATVILRTSLRIRKMDISSILKEARVAEGNDEKKCDGLLGFLGILLMVLSIGMLIIISKYEELNTNPLVILAYIIVLFLGIYLVISRGGNALLRFLKKRKLYLSNLLPITRMHDKYAQNKKILFILSVLSTMTIFLVASPYSLFRLSENIAMMNPNDLEFIQTNTVNQMDENELLSILSMQTLVNMQKVPFVYLYLEENQVNGSLDKSVPVISLSTYEEQTGNTFLLEQGECVNVVVAWQPGNHGIDPGSTLIMYGMEHQYNFQVVKAGHEPYFATGSFPEAGAMPSNVAIVITDVDYEKLQKENSNLLGTYRLIDYEDWKKTGEVVTSLKEVIGNNQAKVISIYDSYVDLKNGYAAFLFVCSVMGVLFFIAGGSVLYFRQYTEITATKVEFNKLFKIGITSQEIKAIIGKEFKVIFFIPLVFGSFAGVSIICLVTNMVGGSDVLQEFLKNTAKVIAFYFACQGCFYWLTKRKYIAQLINGKI